MEKNKCLCAGPGQSKGHNMVQQCVYKHHIGMIGLSIPFILCKPAASLVGRFRFNLTNRWTRRMIGVAAVLYCTVLYSQFTSLLKRKKEKNNFVSFLHVANSLVIPGARYMPIVLCTGGGRTLFEHCRRSGAASWWECGVADDELLLITRCDRLTRFSSKNPLTSSASPQWG